MLATYGKLLARYRNYWLAAILLFFLGIALGILATLYSPETIEQAFQLVGEELQQLGRDILGSSLGQGILILFGHNLRALLLIAALGLALGVYPAFAMVFNGLIIGVVGVLSVQNGAWAAFLAGILPHGVLEIPALWISAAVGLRLGLGPLVARSKSTFAAPSPATWQGYGRELHNALVLLSLCVLLLALAAAIEVGITPRIIALFQ